MIMRLGCRQRGGFSLLETVVALAVFAAAAGALFGLFNANLIALGRVENTAAQVSVVRSAVAVLGAINPAERQEGRFHVGDHDVRWTAALVEPMRTKNVDGASVYQLGLYEIVFHVGDRERRLGTWRMRQVGYRNTMGQAGLSP